MFLTPELTTAMAILVGAVGVVALNLYTARTARLVAMKETLAAIAPIAAKIDNLTPVVERIDTHVNGDKTQAKNELAIRDQEIALQRQTIITMERAAALLAQALATREMSGAVAQAAIAGASTPTQTP